MAKYFALVFDSLLFLPQMTLFFNEKAVVVVVVVVGLRNRQESFSQTMILCAQSKVMGESEWTKRGAPQQK